MLILDALYISEMEFMDQPTDHRRAENDVPYYPLSKELWEISNSLLKSTNFKFE
jgi:hypothetical protein